MFIELKIRLSITICLIIFASLILYSLNLNCANGSNYCTNCFNNTWCNSCSNGYGTNRSFFLGSSVCTQCSPNNCSTCEPYTNCTLCNTGYRITSSSGNNICQACIVSNCEFCNNTASICQSCKWHYRLINSGSICQRCSNLYCGKCQNDINICEACSDGYGIQGAVCVDCLDIQCYKCTFNYNICLECFTGYGVKNNICILCQDTNCYKCNLNSSVCINCQIGYGLLYGQCISCDSRFCSTCSPTNINECYSCLPTYGLSSNKSCNYCSDVNCWVCSANFSVCTQCKIGYGYLNGNVNNSCTLCESTCNTCRVSNNLNCTSCIPQYYIDLDLQRCIECKSQIPYCLQCTNNITCTKCQDNYYVNQSYLCEVCPEHCTLCFYNNIFNSVQCTACQSIIFGITSYYPKLCQEICGDLLVEHSPCDLGLDIQYDGCDDFCQIQYGFQCIAYSNGKTVCSYANQTSMKITAITFVQYKNTIFIKVKVWPPLNIFKTSNNLIDVFTIDDPIFSVKSVAFYQNQSYILMQVDYSADFNGQLLVQFRPNQTFDERYFASVNSSAFKNVLILFYSQLIFNVSKFTKFICFVITSFGMVGIFIGLISKRLAGLQAIFVYQIYWITILYLDSYLFLPFKQTYPLSYTTGYHYKFYNQNHQNNSSRLLLQSSEQQKLSPHLQQFNLDKAILINNFNIFLLLQIIPLIVYLIIFIYQRYAICKKKKLQELGQYQQIIQLRKATVKTNLVKQISCQCLLYFGYLNILNFCLCTYIFFTNNKNQYHFQSLVFLGISAFTYLMTTVIFCLDPDPFDYFRYAFKRNRIGMAFYYLYGPVLVSTLVLIFMLPDNPWASLLPLIMILCFVLAYRPYREIKQNYRSAFNILVILSCLSLRIYLKYSNDPQKINKAYIFNLLNLILLLIVMIVSYISLIYYIVYMCVLKPKDQKNDEEKVMCELDEMNVRNKMQQIKNQQIIFKKLLQPKMNILQFSNSLLPIDHETEENNEKLYQNGENRTRKIKKQIQEQRLDKNTIRQVAQLKFSYINDLKQKMQTQGVQLTRQQRDDNNKIIYAMDVMVKQNQFIRLKNANDYTKELINQKELNQKHQIYIASYQQI